MPTRFLQNLQQMPEKAPYLKRSKIMWEEDFYIKKVILDWENIDFPRKNGEEKKCQENHNLWLAQPFVRRWQHSNKWEEWPTDTSSWSKIVLNGHPHFLTLHKGKKRAFWAFGFASQLFYFTKQIKDTTFNVSAHKESGYSVCCQYIFHLIHQKWSWTTWCTLTELDSQPHVFLCATE